METEKFEIDWEGKKETVEIRRMGYGEKCEFLENQMEAGMGGGGLSLKTYIYKFRPLALIKCIVKAPFPLENQYINNQLDPKIGDLIYKQIAKFNELDEHTRKK